MSRPSGLARTIRFECPDCSLPLEADARGAGQPVECPQCGQLLQVPRASEERKPEIAPAVEPPPQAARERLTPSGKFCIACAQDVPAEDVNCPKCGGGRFGRL